MSKVLVFSGPYDDHHKTFSVTSKSISYVNYILEMNEWEDCDYELYSEDGELLEGRVEILEYFTKLSKDNSITLDKFSNLLIKILPTRRGSWSSYIWVKTGDK